MNDPEKVSYQIIFGDWMRGHILIVLAQMLEIICGLDYVIGQSLAAHLLIYLKFVFFQIETVNRATRSSQHKALPSRA